MGKNNWFRFKQFTIIQEHAAMKVGLDGVLLGAWADIDQCSAILDIGTGTGVIALMAAQRSSARITAIEIDELAYREAMINASNSPWSERVHIQRISFQEFSECCHARFDGIISNPPFFDCDTHSADKRRKTARHTGDLTFTDLMQGVMRLLSPEGSLSVIVPARNLDKIVAAAEKSALFPNRITHVKPNPAKKIHRCMITFSARNGPPEEDTLLIESLVHGDYTEEYQSLTRDFYLAF